MTMTHDAIVIGTGQAGPFLAQRLAGVGMKVAIIERKLFGGTCVNTGCTPTKTMVASAYAAHIVRRAADFGVVNNGSASVDMKLVKSRKEAISEKSRTGVENWLRGMTNCTVYQEHGRFESAKEITVGSERLTADRIFINVGGRAVLPQMPGIEGVPHLNNSSIMDVDFLPRHLIIIGGGYIGLEFAQMYRRFGSEVSIIETASHLAQHEDEDVSTAIRQILEHEGIKVRLNATCIGFSRRGEDILAHVECASGDPEVSGSHVLLAVGRRPNTDDLGLAEAGAAVDKRGYIVVDQLHTSVPGIWALGDCNGKGAFTHTAFNDAEIVGVNLLDNDPRKVSDRITAYALYIDRRLGRAGLTEAAVRKSARHALIGRRPMTKVRRAVEKGETQGFMKIIVDAQTHEVLGAAILGTGGDEAIHSILDVMYAGELQPLSDGAGAPK
jgi:pyruvate/2-oxoglutarate dehydrogenase complex dihydrolipoamide dehydrogenase (E3) component